MTNALIHIFIRDSENTGDSQVREKIVLSGAVGLACNLFLFALKLIIGLHRVDFHRGGRIQQPVGRSVLDLFQGFGKDRMRKHPFPDVSRD